MGEKIFKNLDEQIQILKSKGLIIKNEEYAKEILLRENYFFISGYRHLLTTDDKSKTYVKGATFEELYGTFLFDRRLRNTMFKYILIVENNIKSILSYQLSRKYGYKEKDYLDESNFNNDPLKERQIKDVLSKMKRQIRVNGKHHTATMHYMSNYGYIPMWVLVKVLSMGIVAEFYTILKNEDQEPINGLYGIDTESFSIYLSILSNYRNLCAHEDILYDYRTQKKIPDSIYHEKLQIPTFDGEYLYGKNDLFAVIIILKKMLHDDEFEEVINEIGRGIQLLDDIVDSVPLNRILNRIGFPDHWREILELE